MRLMISPVQFSEGAMNRAAILFFLWSMLFLLRSNRQVHQLQRGAAGDAVWIAERFLHLEMIEPFADDQLDRFAGSFYRSGEVAALALELRRFLGAVGDD